MLFPHDRIQSEESVPKNGLQPPQWIVRFENPDKKNLKIRKNLRIFLKSLRNKKFQPAMFHWIHSKAVKALKRHRKNHF